MHTAVQSRTAWWKQHDKITENYNNCKPTRRNYHKPNSYLKLPTICFKSARFYRRIPHTCFKSTGYYRKIPTPITCEKREEPRWTHHSSPCDIASYEETSDLICRAEYSYIWRNVKPQFYRVYRKSNPQKKPNNMLSISLYMHSHIPINMLFM